MRRTRPKDLGFEDGKMGPRAKKSRQPLEVKKFKERFSFSFQKEQSTSDSSILAQ